MESCLTESTVEIIIEGNARERQPVEELVPQCSSGSLIPLALYSSAVIKLVGKCLSPAEEQSFGANISWVETGSEANQIITRIE